MHRPPEQKFAVEHVLAAGLLGLALVLLLRRYAGINHDAVLYLGQALLLRWPEIFGSDLAFVHGTGQERYTAFPFLISRALDLAPPGTVFAVGALAAVLAFAAACWFCLRAVVPERDRYWAWLGVLVLPAGYGMTNTFSYGEQFLTARPFAEAACLAAIAFIARRRMWLSFGCLALAFLLHPLQAIAATLVLWIWLVLDDRRWLHAAWIAVPVAIVGALGVAPFGGLWQSIDPEWLANLRGATAQLFVMDWSPADFNVLLFDICMLAYAWRTLDGRFAAWCGAALGALLLGVSASLMLVDWLHLVLPAQLQLWRVHWLAHWFATAAIMLLLMRDIQARDAPRALLLVLALLTVRSMASWAWPPLAALYAAWPMVLQDRTRLRSILGVLLGAGIVVLFVAYVIAEWAVFSAAHHRLDLYAFDRKILLFPVIGLGLPLLAMRAWRQLSPVGRRAALVLVLCPLVVLAALRWDARSPINLEMERSAYRSDVFGVGIPQDAQVYWTQHMLTGPWVVLKRASYFSPHQITGQVFNRGLSIDSARRIEKMRPVIEESMGCELRTLRLDERERCHVSDQAMRHACAATPVPGPDFLVLVHRQPQPWIGTWSIRDPVTGAVAATYYLYRCSDVMSHPEPTGTSIH